MTTNRCSHDGEHTVDLSPTAHLLEELQLFGHRPFEDEPDSRPLPEPNQLHGALADIFDALVATLSDTRLEPDLPDLLWSVVNLFHRRIERMPSTFTRCTPARLGGRAAARWSAGARGDDRQPRFPASPPSRRDRGAAAERRQDRLRRRRRCDGEGREGQPRFADAAENAPRNHRNAASTHEQSVRLRSCSWGRAPQWI